MNGIYNKTYFELKLLHIRALQNGALCTAERIAKQMAILARNNENMIALDEPQQAA
jgi:hypothetical protein